METDENAFLCHQCGKTFHKLSTLESHTKWKHSEKTFEFVCELCGRIFQKKYNYQKHMQTGVHGMADSINCAVDGCGFKAMNRKMMGNHYQRFHGISLKENTEYFNTFEEFCIWKSEFESKTNARFVKMSSSRMKKDGCTKTTYYCHRDGNFTPKGKNIRHIKLKGSNKINAHCPAKIDVEAGEKLVLASYINTHVGHDLDATRISLDLAEKAVIAHKLSMKVPFEDILLEVNSTSQSSGSGFKRMNQITRKDLWNIVETFKLNPQNIVDSQNRLKRKRSVGELKRHSKLKQNFKLQSKSVVSDGQVIYSLSDSEENQVFDKQIILVAEEDDEEIQEYALVSDVNNTDEEDNCLVINEQGELQTINGHKVVYTNEDGDIFYEEDELRASTTNNNDTPTILNSQTETDECEMSVVDKESGHVIENVSWDDIFYIDGEAYRIERSIEDKVDEILPDNTNGNRGLPVTVPKEGDQNFDLGGNVNQEDGSLEEKPTIVGTKFDIIEIDSSKHFDSTSPQVNKEEEDSCIKEEEESCIKEEEYSCIAEEENSYEVIEEEEGNTLTVVFTEELS